MASNFLQQLQQLIEANLSDTTFGISEICQGLNISRTHLHRKITGETGLSTSHYIRYLRMQKAKALLKTTDLLIFEVAHQVGYNNITFFSSCFSETFGCSPTTFRKRKYNTMEK